MKRFLAICISVLLLLTTACAPANSGEQASTAPAADASATASVETGPPIEADPAIAELVKNDLDFLLKELKANYPYSDSINETLWQQDVSYVAQQLSEMGMDHALYLSAISQVLADAVSMRVNLGPVGIGEYDFYRNGESPYSNAAWIESLANAANTKSFYDNLRTQTGATGETLVTDSSFETHLLMDGKLGYVRIRQFGSEIDDGDREALLEFFQTIGDAETLVLDIRGNSGDCPPEKWHTLISLLAKESSVSEQHMLIRDGETVAATNNSFAAFDNVTYEPLAQADLPSGIDPSIKSLSSYVKTITTQIEPDPESILYGGEIYLLTDGGTRGQMDAFAQHAAASGFATLAGAQTGGLGVMGQELAMTALPSGVLVRYASEYGLNPDGSNNLVGGAVPEMVTGDNDAFEAVVGAIDPTANANEIARSVKPVNPVITIEMENGGIITAELYPDIAPNTVANFVTLIQSGFYDGTIFHRVIPGFMIQGGDPDGTGMGGPDYSIKGEFAINGFQNNLKHERGVLSMARSSHPDSAGSQFFIMHDTAAYLDGQYAAFGKVLTGLDVVDEIVNAPRGQNDRPNEPMSMKKVTVDTFGVEYSVQKLSGIR